MKKTDLIIVADYGHSMINNEKLNFAAGGGIVYDSNPEDEYIESLEKVSIFLKFFSKGSFTW